jgi:hypothetical protein
MRCLLENSNRVVRIGIIGRRLLGLTAHLALAFEPSKKAKMIAMMNGSDDSNEGEQSDAIAYNPDFELIREDYYVVHRVLRALAEGDPDLDLVGTIVEGVEAVSEAGMGIQYFYKPETIRLMADAYRQVTPAALMLAIEKVRPEFDGYDEPALDEVPEKFEVIREELAVVAKGGWAMIAGMF